MCLKRLNYPIFAQKLDISCWNSPECNMLLHVHTNTHPLIWTWIYFCALLDDSVASIKTLPQCLVTQVTQILVSDASLIQMLIPQKHLKAQRVPAAYVILSVFQFGKDIALNHLLPKPQMWFNKSLNNLERFKAP